MNLTFYKYHGTSNDFILIDNRNNLFDKTNTKFITYICNRQLGVGADGLILLEESNQFDFKMTYFNSDGTTGAMCGNGGRCIVAFAKLLQIITDTCVFEAILGNHKASIDTNNIVTLQLMDVEFILEDKEFIFLNTGSPHYVTFMDKIADLNVKSKGRKIRNSTTYSPNGTNVNFAEQLDHSTFKVRTYERGVEDETLSCGTGVVAVAIGAFQTNRTSSNTVKLKTLGGTLEVSFKQEEMSYTDIYLKGPTEFVFEGKVG